MLEDYYVKPSTVDRVRGSWLAPQIESYLEWLEAHCYTRLVVYRRLPLLFHFAEFAQKKGCNDIASCNAYIKEFVSQWLEQHGAKPKTVVAVRKHAIDAECGVRQMLQLACKEPGTRKYSANPGTADCNGNGRRLILDSDAEARDSTDRGWQPEISLLDRSEAERWPMNSVFKSPMTRAMKAQAVVRVARHARFVKELMFLVRRLKTGGVL